MISFLAGLCSVFYGMQTQESVTVEALRPIFPTWEVGVNIFLWGGGKPSPRKSRLFLESAPRSTAACSRHDGFKVTLGSWSAGHAGLSGPTVPVESLWCAPWYLEVVFLLVKTRHLGWRGRSWWLPGRTGPIQYTNPKGSCRHKGRP